MNKKTAVVLAAGEGTRLRPLTHNRPKPMLPAANQPVLKHVLDSLVEVDIGKIVLVVGYRRERVQEYFGSTYRDIPIEYVVQKKQLGSGHALLQAESAVSGPCVVLNGDQLVDGDSVKRVLDEYEETGSDVLAVVERANASRYGVVKLDGQRVGELIEKPDSDEYRLINAGIYAFSEAIFETIRQTSLRDGELVLPDAIERHIETREVRAVHIDGLWADATYPWDLLEIATEVLDQGRVTEPEIRDRVWVDPAAHVHENATLIPPLVIGADCEVGPGTVVGPTVSLAQNTTLGSNVTIERSVIDTDCRIGHGSILVDAVLGQDVHLGVNTTVSGGPSDVRVGNQIHESQQLGAILADRVYANGSVTFSSGTLVGSETSIESGVTVRTNTEERAKVVR